MDNMDDDPSSFTTPGEYVDSNPEKEIGSMQTYLDSVPYECESFEEMQAKLEDIVGKIYICAKAKNWLVLSSWDGMLQCWLGMRYPIAKSLRAKLARLYYELCLLPGIEPRVIRSWAEVLARLLSNKPGMRRKLENTDLELNWQPLWRVLYKELWPKGRIVMDSTRNLVNILLYVAEQCNRYFPTSEIPSMLETFFPMFTKETYMTMIPVITSFLPPTNIHLYMPTLFKIWEAFNSTVIDDRLLELTSKLSEEHVSGTSPGADDGAKWKDVGIWTQAEWNFLIGKGLASMNVPVGTSKGSSATSNYADSYVQRQPRKIKKSVNRYHAIATMLVYSMAVDGNVRDVNTPKYRDEDRALAQGGFIAGSKALDSLDRLITSTESFFHPSNSGAWTVALTNFIQLLTYEFLKRIKEEEQPDCQTPITQRLTPTIRRAFVTTLRTPALLAMFSKDAVSLNYAQSALRSLAILEPGLMMPELLERAYGGLEVVNETHRTTAVLSMLSTIARPLVSERIWLGGQKHLVPLLELCLPGIDLNDPTKTVCATMFIVAVVQHMKIGDLTLYPSGLIPSSGDSVMEFELPPGSETGRSQSPVLSREDEISLVRDSTAGFADWVTSLFRRVLALYENLPEEGGKKNTTGGKQEENVLKSIKSMMDIVSLHLSEPLFELVLNLVYDYGTTNAKSNAVRAFGQLVACLARVRPEKTMAKFLPFCASQIREELSHGASSVRTTSSSRAALPSDTTLHWNLSILRGCLGYGGPIVSTSPVEVQGRTPGAVDSVVEKTKSERGYSASGRLMAHVLNTLAGVYPLNSRFVNSDEWDEDAFNQDHNLHWGRLYDPQDVVIEWHVPSPGEIDFVLEILDQIAKPALDKLEALSKLTSSWDNANRNDFCRYLHACRSIWSSLPTFCQEHEKVVPNPCSNTDFESPELLVSHLDVKAGFTLTNVEDPRYQHAIAYRHRFGDVILRAASALRQNTTGEDHIDAVIGVARAIDVYLLDYAMSRSGFDAIQKNYTQARDLNRLWPKQKENSRLVFVKRAQVYHSNRVYMHALYRRRSLLEDNILKELVELSLSPYTRVRRHAQSVLHSACGYYVRSTRYILHTLLDALSKGNDPDRMKGALYVLWNKGTDQAFHKRYLLALLECQHEEKPSIQKLVNNLAQDCLSHLKEESVNTDIYTLATPRVESALSELKQELSLSAIDQNLLAEVLDKGVVRIAKRGVVYHETWRYVQMASSFLSGLLRRDVAPSPDVAKFFLDQSSSPQPTIRGIAQKGIVYILTIIKIRTYANTGEELWFDEWHNPLQKQVPIKNPKAFVDSLNTTARTADGLYIDKIRTGFLTWAPTIKAYQPVVDGITPPVWDHESAPCLRILSQATTMDTHFSKLTLLWSQESIKTGSSLELRPENVSYIKSLAKMFLSGGFDRVLVVIEPLLCDPDKFKQRAGAEILTGLLRGSKHWQTSESEKLWQWTVSRLDQIFAQIKPDTLSFWESVFTYLLQNRDPRRSTAFVDWILSLPLEFNGDSAFAMNKPLSIFGILVDTLGLFFNKKSDAYAQIFLENANTGYAEMRGHICQNLSLIARSQWQPSYNSTAALLLACRETQDPLHIHKPRYLQLVSGILEKLPKLKEERLPPPRVNQSEYDRIGLTFLQWIWTTAYTSQASLLFPYVMPMLPEIFCMSELSDSTDVQVYSSAVLYVLSAVSPPVEYIATILDNFVIAIKSSTSWRIRLHALPALVVFFYRNLLSISPSGVAQVMDALLDCLSDENVEVREMASKALSGVVRCSQRQSIMPLKNRFVALTRKVTLPPRRDPTYPTALRSLHAAILGICALIESFPYSVEKWMPSLTEVLAPHSTDPPPISTTIRKCASEFKKDTWHKDQQMFDEDQLQSLATMLVGTSYFIDNIKAACLACAGDHPVGSLPVTRWLWARPHQRTIRFQSPRQHPVVTPDSLTLICSPGRYDFELERYPASLAMDD
ncbi:hypothetical protein BD779DRAFT_1607229 [Infundibulicybe gibba]|nr:hypothetical protein BD779DRAFT_1607229 [Infundibulicybe gibba]